MNSDIQKRLFLLLKTAFAVLLLSWTGGNASAQKQKDDGFVAGIVTDRVTEEPLVGVAIYFDGQSYGVITDENGYYSIRRPENGGTLVFSLIGYETRSISIRNHAKMDVTLVEARESLDDVIVTGFAPIRKDGFSGNTTKIRKDEILMANPTNMISAIQTFDPSFRIQQNIAAGSNPNAMPDITLRGQTSISGTSLDTQDISKQSLSGTANLPIFILDGFEVDVEKIYDLDPTRIHSINILKDAAATALYGSRAANGVIVVELRAPEAGKLRLQYNTTLSMDMPDLSSYNLMTASEKLEAERLAGLYDSSMPTVSPYTNGYYERMNNILQGVDTYWLALGLRTAFSQRHSVYVDGGENDVRWGIELNYTGNNGVMKESSRNVTSAGFYVDYRIGRFQIKNKATFTFGSSSDLPFNSFSDYSHLQPYFRVYDEDGNYLRQLESFTGYNGSLVNPLYEMYNYNSYDKSSYNEIVDNLLVNWDIAKGLRMRLQLSATIKRDKSELYKDPASSSYGTGSLSLNGDKTVTSGDSNILDGTLQIMYNRSIKKHYLNLNLSGNLRATTYETEYASYRGFPGGDLTSSNYAAEIVDKPSRNDERSRLLGFLLTGNYAYDNIYFADLTGRLDGSSEFGSNRRWSMFWAAGAGVNIHNYEFLKNSVLSTLKLRGSYGLTGKTNFSQYSARNLYQLQTGNWFPTGYGVYLSQMGNKDLQWERTYQLDLGFEFGLWRDRIFLKASCYNARTVDLITDFALPSSTGFTSHKENMGVVRNLGVELDLRVRLYQDRDWMVSVFGNFARNKNTVVEISEAMKAYNEKVEKLFSNYDPTSSTSSEYSKPYLKYYEGASMTAIAGMKSLGISPSNGKEIYMKPNGEVTDKWSAEDWVAIGDTAPLGQGSFGLTASFREWSVFTSFLYNFGGDAYNSTLVDYVENVDLANENVDRRVLMDRWQKPGDVTTMKDIRDRNITTGASSRFVQKDNTLQFSSVTLSYDFKPGVLKKAHISMCKLSLTAKDIFYLSTIRRERGLSYPYSRAISLSINIGF
ncbi:MAG: SusC/RagA family TonB-linked outer membrane protein [Bacteroidales bacterium]|nr:SusC/RagA family TonB-linked outer membrane protein [Bacteroidales bacterium]